MSGDARFLSFAALPSPTLCSDTHSHQLVDCKEVCCATWVLNKLSNHSAIRFPSVYNLKLTVLGRTLLVITGSSISNIADQQLQEADKHNG